MRHLIVTSVCAWLLLVGTTVVSAQSPAPTSSQPPVPVAAEPPDPRAAMPERPTVATHAHTVAPGYLEIEAGGTRQTLDDAIAQGQVQSLLKIGLARHLQLDVAPGWMRLSDGVATHTGFTDLVAGLKWQMTDGAPVIGDFALQATVKFRTASAASDIGTGTTDLNLLAISSHEFGPVAMDVNVGYTRRSGDGSRMPKAGWMWTVSYGVPVTGKLGWVAEFFGFPALDGSTTVAAFLTGPMVTVTRSVVIDGGAIFGITGFGGTAIYAGVTWNVGRLWGSPAGTTATGK